MGNPVVHFEVMGSDLDQLISFYGEVFGWQIQNMPEMNYGMVDTGSATGINGGLASAEDGTSYVTFYIEVEDTDATLKAIEEAGGKTVVPTTVVPDVVTFAQFADPAGNVVGLVKSEPGQDERSGGDASKSDVSWFEVLGKDVDDLAAFYTKLFDWKTKRTETDQFIYHEVDTQAGGKGSFGGIGNTPDGTSQCTVYAGVEDVTKTLERAEELGGKIVMPETNVSDSTVIGLLSDPQGNTFGVYKRQPA